MCFITCAECKLPIYLLMTVEGVNGHKDTQPASEAEKQCLILCMSAYLARRRITMISKQMINVAGEAT